MAKLITGVNDLQTKYPDIAAQWHPTLNGNLKPTEIAAGSSDKAWWLGPCGHEWLTRVGARTCSKSGCPICSRKENVRKIIAKKTALAISHPQLAAEWHPTKNGDLTPYNVSFGTNKKVWWKCEQGHEWEAIINNRSHGTGCPICNAIKIRSKS